jgi:hypothetical protein
MAGMANVYYETVTKLEQMGVDREYIQGWMVGFLRNPKREEQRVTEAYEAGYADGMNRNTEHSEAWIQK